MSITRINFSAIETERLLLRKLTMADAGKVFDLRSNDEVNKYLDRVKTKSIDEAEAFITKINTGIEHHEWLYWAIALKNDPSLMTGTICLWNFSADAAAEIGYELMPAYQGMGIMQEAIGAVIEFGFKKTALKMIKAYTHIHNNRSSRLLEKFNFTIKTKYESQDGNEDELKNMFIYTLSAM